MNINWQWVAAALTIAILCFLAIWLPFWLAEVWG
jgi:hypothetical protein